MNPENIDYYDFNLKIYKNRDSCIYKDLANISRYGDFTSQEISNKLKIEEKYIKHILNIWMSYPNSHMDIGQYVKLKNGKWKFLEEGDKYFNCDINEIRETFK
jgi:hypothetical protein